MAIAEFKKNKFYCHKSPIHLTDVDIEKVLVSNKISLGEKTINTLLVTCIIIIKLSCYVQCFLKQAQKVTKVAAYMTTHHD